MNHGSKKQHYRGVLCIRCNQPIALPAIIKSREPSPAEELHSRVFTLRCRACYKEGLYAESDSIECEGVPRATFS
jgi:hypothetical protein